MFHSTLNNYRDFIICPATSHSLGRNEAPTVEPQSLPYQDSSCDYRNDNQPVITLRACQAFEGMASILINVTTTLTEVPSCYGASFEPSPAGMCWLRYPSCSYCSSSNLLTQNIFNLSFSQKWLRGPPGLIPRVSKEKADTDICKFRLGLMATAPESSATTSKWVVSQKAATSSDRMMMA